MNDAEKMLRVLKEAETKGEKYDLDKLSKKLEVITNKTLKDYDKKK
jgi:hypothetical protein